ncbi:MAG: hypothetical protein WC046_05680 [Candidatus Bathyarchaeia archaeon]
MKEKVAVATVQGKVYYFIANALREKGISFFSLIPGEPIPSRAKLVITTNGEKGLVDYPKILIYQGEEELDSLLMEIKKILSGKETYEKIIIGIDPGEVIGLAILADGKIMLECNCYSGRELVNSILKILKTINFSVTSVIVKIGTGVPVYKELLWDLDDTLPDEVMLEVVNETGTNRHLTMHSRKIRHISSAIRIAGRTGRILMRKKVVAANSTRE